MLATLVIMTLLVGVFIGVNGTIATAIFLDDRAEKRAKAAADAKYDADSEGLPGAPESTILTYA